MGATELYFPWYDSFWLQLYAEAREILQEHAPAKLPEFESALNLFRCEDNFQTLELPGFLDGNQLTSLIDEISRLPQDLMEHHELMSFGRQVVHNHEPFLQFQSDINEQVSELCGEAVETSYNFLSLYNNLGVCDVHLDAPQAKWTLDICIDQSDAWPIYISDPVPWPESPLRKDDLKAHLKQDPDVQFRSHVAQPGDALLFSGPSQWHYRDRIARTQSNNFSHLLFLHFIPVGSQALLKPRNWASELDMPELSALTERIEQLESRYPGYCDS